MAHVAQSKKDTVKTFTKLLEEYPIIGAVNVENMPAKQLQRLREQLRETVLIKMTKRRLFYHAIDGSKKENIQELKNHLKGMPALLFTKENPFTLFKNIKKNKSQAPIKAGQIAPNDILVKAGPTPFAPGPIIGELGAFKIKTGVEDGKIAIKEDCIVAKEGEEVSQALASILARLGIEPMEIGLNVSAIYENGEILTKDVLDIDTDAYLDNLKLCGSDAFKLAMEIAYSCPDTINLLLAKAHTDAKTIATEQDILTDETVKDVLAKANLQAESLNSKLDLPAVEAKAEAPKEEKVEETKEEAKEEETPKEEEAALTEEEKSTEAKPEEAPEEKKE